MGLGRVELPTRGLGNRCSIHLSYRPTRATGRPATRLARRRSGRDASCRVSAEPLNPRRCYSGAIALASSVANEKLRRGGPLQKKVDNGSTITIILVPFLASQRWLGAINRAGPSPTAQLFGAEGVREGDEQ